MKSVNNQQQIKLWHILILSTTLLLVSPQCRPLLMSMSHLLHFSQKLPWCWQKEWQRGYGSLVNVIMTQFKKKHITKCILKLQYEANWIPWNWLQNKIKNYICQRCRNYFSVGVVTTVTRMGIVYHYNLHYSKAWLFNNFIPWRPSSEWRSHGKIIALRVELPDFLKAFQRIWETFSDNSPGLAERWLIWRRELLDVITFYLFLQPVE